MVKKLSDMHRQDVQRFFRSDRSGSTIEFSEIMTGPLMSLDDEIRFRSFLLGFRLFTLKNEPVYVDYVVDAAKSTHAEPAYRELVELLRERISQWRTKGGFLVRGIASRELTTRESFDLFVYGRLFHLDSDKRSTLDQMDEFVLRLFEFEFRHMVCSMFNNIQWLDHVIQNRTSAKWIGETLAGLKAALSN